MIGFEENEYTIPEDAGSLTICAAIGENIGMENNRDLYVGIITINGGMSYKFQC